MQFGGELQLQADHRYIINVGSVGQPRDLNPQASYVLYDSQERHVTWRRVEYPIYVVAEKNGPPQHCRKHWRNVYKMGAERNMQVTNELAEAEQMPQGR